MENKQIESTSLPLIPGIAKDLVNYGRWFLYEVAYESNKDVRYLLSTNNSDFLLKIDGEIICPLPKDAQIDYLYQIAFTDIPKPQTTNFVEI